MGMYFECELNKIDIDEVLSTVRYIEPEDLVVLYREKIRRLESALKNSEDDNIRRSEMNKELSGKVKCLGNNNRELLKENKRLRADLEESHANSIRLVAELKTAKNVLVEANKKLFNSQFGLQSMPCHDLMTENHRLLQRQASLETQINILNVVSDGYKDDIGKLIHENEKLKTENKHLLKENKDLKESVKKLKEEREILSTKQVYFEDQINTLNATCEGYADNLNAYRKDVDQLTRENKELIEERDALWDETQHLDKIYKQLLNEKKRLQENFEELKASSDLSMTAELAEIFAEFTVKDKENRDNLSVKIDEFREKYQFE
jgi:chromosome segregation ATPase